MLKGIHGPSAFGRLLKDTKVAQLQASIGSRELNANNGFPTHQVVESPASSFSRRDFGLKMRIPKKIKTRRIIVNDLDNKYGLPNFETLNGDYFKKLRFQELGIPVNATYTQFINSSNSSQNKSTTTQNPLFASSREFSSPQNIAGLLHIKNQPLNSKEFAENIKPQLKALRKPFYKWLMKNHPESISKKSLYDEFKRYIELEKPQLFGNSKNYIPSTYAEKLSGTGGLSYNLKGRLFQTPNGPKTSRVVPGRIVSKYSNYTKCTVGGFVGNVGNVAANNSYVETLALQNRSIEDDKFAREFKIPATVVNATMVLDNKSLDLTVNPIKRASNFGKRTITRRNPAEQSLAFSSLMNLLNDKEKSSDK
ncbi:hypothetical protein PMKS-003454 [Pichia membranifaciens]|uniref:Uncharacterized protein n=1 Tax=Pichia membranifaciens TaxID=4926 RepID=A0A1Q2YK61_9ASCO|nr:hypothetical protein PMKS-003454 [Pichia membranifaciens]